MRSDAVGPPAPNVELRIAPDGEVQFKSPGMFVGYFREPDKTREAMTEDGYVRTGDAGFFEPDGQLKIVDRAKDVGRLTNGQMFAPKYIENKLKFFPNIREAVAIGDGREFVTAMINIELASVGDWAERNNVSYASYQELAAHPRVNAMIEEHVDAVNHALSREPMMAGAQIRRFLILPKELDADDGELTRTQKVRRALHRRALRAADRRRCTTAPPRRRSPPKSPTRTAARASSPEPRASSTRRPTRKPTEALRGMSERGRRHSACGRERLAVLRRRARDIGRVVRHPQRRDPRHHRPERRRQDLDAQRGQRLLSSAGGPDHLSRPHAFAHEAARGGRAAASRAPSRTSPCSRA